MVMNNLQPEEDKKYELVKGLTKGFTAMLLLYEVIWFVNVHINQGHTRTIMFWTY